MEVLGVDIGGSGIKAAPVDIKKGVLLAPRKRIPTPRSRKPKPMAAVVAELADHFKGGKPLILYVFGQSFNLFLTLLVAYIMFYLVFPELTATI